MKTIRHWRLASSILAACLWMAAPYGGSRPTASVPSAPPDAPAASSELYGVGAYWGDGPRVYAAMGAAGVGWAREEAFNRDHVHLGPGQFDWHAPDYIVTEAVRNQVQLVGLLWTTPGWDSTLPPEDPNYDVSPPRDYEQWGDYVFQTVSRYKDRVHYWEVWNEEDSSSFLPGYWGGTPAEFAHLLAVAYTEIKRADPAAKVLIGGSAAGVFDDGLVEACIGFFDAILADPINPAARYFDIMSVHVYGTQFQIRSQMSQWWEFLAERGLDDRPLWVTEFGWPSAGSDQEQDPDFCCGPDAQASYLRTLMPEVVQVWGAEKVFWFEIWLDDNPEFWERFQSYGLLDSSYQPKPAYNALKDLIAAPSSSASNWHALPHRTGPSITGRSWPRLRAATAR